MTSYRVLFFKRLTNSYGRSCNICQRSIEIASMPSSERAVAAAKNRFAQLEGVPDWRLRADTVEVTSLLLDSTAGVSATAGLAETESRSEVGTSCRASDRAPAARGQQ